MGGGGGLAVEEGELADLLDLGGGVEGKEDFRRWWRQTAMETAAMAAETTAAAMKMSFLEVDLDLEELGTVIEEMLAGNEAREAGEGGGGGVG